MSANKPSKRKTKPEVIVSVIVAIIALIGTISAALIGNWDKIWTSPSQSSSSVSSPTMANPPQATVTTPQQATPSPTPINLDGRWRDQFGNITHLVQRGDTVTATSSGVACRGHFDSTGSGTIIGNILESTYQSTYSTGQCRGRVASDGRRITSSCHDSVCGAFTTSSVKLD
jgi:hypothetical protein